MVTPAAVDRGQPDIEAPAAVAEPGHRIGAHAEHRHLAVGELLLQRHVGAPGEIGLERLLLVVLQQRVGSRDQHTAGTGRGQRELGRRLRPLADRELAVAGPVGGDIAVDLLAVILEHQDVALRHRGRGAQTRRDHAARDLPAVGTKLGQLDRAIGVVGEGQDEGCHEAIAGQPAGGVLRDLLPVAAEHEPVADLGRQILDLLARLQLTHPGLGAVGTDPEQLDRPCRRIGGR